MRTPGDSGPPPNRIDAWSARYKAEQYWFSRCSIVFTPIHLQTGNAVTLLLDASHYVVVRRLLLYDSVRRLFLTSFIRNATDAAAITPPVSSHAWAVARVRSTRIKPAASHGTTRPPGMTNGLSAAPTSSRRSRHTARLHARYTSRTATSATIASLTYVPVMAMAHTIAPWIAIATCGVWCGRCTAAS